MRRAFQLPIRFNLVIATGALALGVFISLVFEGRCDALSLAVVWILTWQIYTLDRVIKQPEDKLTQRRSVEELVFMQKRAKLFKALLVASMIAELVLFAFRPFATIGVVLGIGGGLMYSLKIPLIGVRVKQIPMIKSVYVPAILVGYCFLTPWVFPSTAEHWVILALLLVAFGINVSLFDLRDAGRDKSAGIITVANFLGEKGLLIGLWPLSLVAAGVPLIWWRTPEMIAASAGVLAVALSSLRLWKPAPSWWYTIFIDGTMIVPALVYLAIRRAF